MLSDPRPATGRVPVVLYIATPASDAEAARIMSDCRTYADARHWTPAVAITDNDPAVPLAGRPGWREASDALSTGTASGIVTWERAMLAADAAAYETLVALVADRGAFLAIASSGQAPIETRSDIAQPHRTPGQMQRRRNIADAASGFPARATVVLYACIAPSQDQDQEQVLAQLRRHAEVCDWGVVGEVVDHTPTATQLEARPNWDQAKTLITSGRARGIVTTAGTACAGAFGSPTLAEWLHDQHAFLSEYAPVTESVVR